MSSGGGATAAVFALIALFFAGGHAASQFPQRSWPVAKPSDKATSTAPESAPTPDADLQKADFHYKVGVLALQNNDLAVAEREFRESARLAPKKALSKYNLAVVLSKRNNSLAAMDWLRAAMALGLPDAERARAEELLVSLTYESRKSGSVAPFLGDWQMSTATSDRGSECSERTNVRRHLRVQSLKANDIVGQYTRDLTVSLSPLFRAAAELCRNHSGSTHSEVDMEATYNPATGRFEGLWKPSSCSGLDCPRDKSWDTIFVSVSGGELTIRFTDDEPIVLRR